MGRGGANKRSAPVSDEIRPRVSEMLRAPHEDEKKVIAAVSRIAAEDVFGRKIADEELLEKILERASANEIVKFKIADRGEQDLTAPAFVGYMGQLVALQSLSSLRLLSGTKLSVAYLKSQIRAHGRRGKPVDLGDDELPLYLSEFEDGARELVHTARQIKEGEPLVIPHLIGGKQGLLETEKEMLEAREALAEDLAGVDRVICVSWPSEDQQQVSLTLRAGRGEQIAQALEVEAETSLLDGHPELHAGGITVAAKRGYITISIPQEKLAAQANWRFAPAEVPGFAASDNARAYKKLFGSW